MIVWQGKGWLVAVIIFGCSLSANLITNWWTGSEDYWMQTKLPLAASLLVSGAICWFFGLRFEKEPTRVLVDEATGEKFILEPKHTLFWVPMKWCGALAMVGSILLTAYELMPGAD